VTKRTSSSLVHVFVACTKRKSQQPRDGLRLSEYQGRFSARADAWINRVADEAGDVQALDLYTGESWFVAKQICSKMEELCSLWAISAGFGLVHSGDLLTSYSATLSAGHADSISRSGDQVTPTEATKMWWGKLCERQIPSNGDKHKSINSVANAYPESALVVCGGRDYLIAIVDDVIKAKSQLSDPRRLVVFGAGNCPDPRIGDSWVQVSAKARQAVGGTMRSLSVRVAQRVLEATEPNLFNSGSAQTVLSRLTASLDEFPQYRARRMSDQEIAAWILAESDERPSLTQTFALRKLRDSGRACEQGRFGALFTETMGATR